MKTALKTTGSLDV